MATKIDIDETTSSVRALIDRIRSLRAEGNTDGAEELRAEAELIISTALKATAHTGLRKSLREALALAMAVEPVTTDSGTAVVLASASETIATSAEIDELVAQGAREVANIADSQFNGPARIAEIMMDMRRRFYYDGAPDIMAAGSATRIKAAEIYSRVLDALPPRGESASADAVRKEVGRLKKSVRNAMEDVRVAYAKSLDLPGEDADAERTLYVDIIDADSDVPVSEQFAQYYGFALKTHAEVMRERRAAAKELDAGASSSSSAAPADRLSTFVKRLWTGLDTVAELSDTDVAQLDTESREKILVDIESQINRLTALRDQLS